MATSPSTRDRAERGAVRVALIGTRGFGAVHLEHLARLAAAGTARLVGVVDVVEPPADLGVPRGRTLAELLVGLPAAEQPQIVIVATPIGTHVPFALEALEAGCDVYLEKPPVPALSDHGLLADAARAAGLSVQVGFQAQGGAGIDELRRAVRDRRLGRIETVRAHAAWQRDRAYYARSAWAGRRRLDGRRVADGVATNALAHSVQAALTVAGIDSADQIAQVTTELRRAHDIEADDTTFLRIDPASAAPDGSDPPGAGAADSAATRPPAEHPAVVCALTLAAAEQSDPWVEIVGDRGSMRLHYTTDRATLLDADGAVSHRSFDRRDLLANLCDHVRDRAVPLISPLASTSAFSAVLEAIQSVPDPLPIGPEEVEWVGTGPAARPVIRDVEGVLDAALVAGRPFSEAGAPWARGDAIGIWRPPTAESSGSSEARPEPGQMARRMRRIGDAATWEDTGEEVRRAWDAPYGPAETWDVSVEDRRAPGPHGPVPVRIYAPLPATAPVRAGGETAETAARAAGRPCLVWCHGGGFTHGDLDMPEADAVARGVAGRAGAVVVSVDYRLCDQADALGGARARSIPGTRDDLDVHAPIPLDDVVAAFRWTVARAADLGIDPSRVALGGASAGGCLAAGASIRLTDAGDPPAASLLIYPVAHTQMPEPTAEEAFALAETPPPLRMPDWVLRAMAEAYLGRSRDEAMRYEVPGLAAPAQLAGLPPTYVEADEHDDLRPSARRYAEQLAAAGVRVRYEVRRGVCHGHLNRVGLPEAAESMDAMATVVAAL